MLATMVFAVAITGQASIGSGSGRMARDPVDRTAGLVEIKGVPNTKPVTKEEKAQKKATADKATQKKADPANQAVAKSRRPVVKKRRYMSQEEMVRRDMEKNGGVNTDAGTNSVVNGLRREFATHGSLRYQGMDGYVHEFGKGGDRVIGPAVGLRVGPDGLVGRGPILYGR
jgi:hypothetical protein